MRDCVKVLLIGVVAFLTVLFLYPVLHELGHGAGAVLCGAQVVELQLFPVPSVLCHISGEPKISAALIGGFGIFLPFFVSLLLRGKLFWVWLTSFCLKVVSAVAFGCSCVAILCHRSNIYWEREDIVTVIRLTQTSPCFWWLLMAVFFCCNIFILYKNKPVERIKAFFENQSLV